ncbi:MAG: ABC transporter substrate-binding protein [Pseudomonadota bacterium]
MTPSRETVKRLTVALCIVLGLAACAEVSREPVGDTQTDKRPRIVSLDYCADQFVLALADRYQIAGLSPDASAPFSYLRKEARGLPKVRARMEDILLRRPDVALRTYGGGANAQAMLERAGIDVIQIGYANDLADIRKTIRETADALGALERGERLIDEMDRRIDALASPPATRPQVLYLTSKGAVAGKGTLINELIDLAGFANFEQHAGWRTVSLEALAYAAPDTIAASFFDTGDTKRDLWTPSRHPVAKARLANADVVNLPGAWTACAAWYVLDVAEALDAARQKQAPEKDGKAS